MKKQVRFDVEEELGDDPMLPPDLTTYLVGGMAEEQNDAPSPSTPLPLESPWLPPSKGPQCQLTYMGGAWTTVQARPPAA